MRPLALVCLVTALALACGGPVEPPVAVTPPAAAPPAAAPPAAPPPAASLTAPAPSPLASWQLPADLDTRLRAAGWSVTSCAWESEDGLLTSSCKATKGPLAARVDVSDLASAEEAAYEAEGEPSIRRDGRRLLTVDVRDQGAAEELGVALLPPGASIRGLTADHVSQIVTARGWFVAVRSEERTQGEVDGEVTAARPDREAEVEWSWEPTAEAAHGESRELDSGEWSVDQRPAYLSVVVSDAAATRELLDTLR